MTIGSSDCLPLLFILAQTFFPAHAFIFVFVLFPLVLSQYTPSSFKVFDKINYSFDPLLETRRTLEPASHTLSHLSSGCGPKTMVSVKSLRYPSSSSHSPPLWSHILAPVTSSYFTSYCIIHPCNTPGFINLTIITSI